MLLEVRKWVIISIALKVRGVLKIFTVLHKMPRYLLIYFKYFVLFIRIGLKDNERDNVIINDHYLLLHKREIPDILDKVDLGIFPNIVTEVFGHIKLHKKGSRNIYPFLYLRKLSRN